MHSKENQDVESPTTIGGLEDFVGWVLDVFRGKLFERALSAAQTAVVLGGIWFALNQAHALKESIDTSTWSSIDAEMNAVDQKFVDHPELIPFFYAGVDIQKTDYRYNSVYAMANLLLDFLDDSTSLSDHIDPKLFEPKTWARYYKWQFEHSPILCRLVWQEGGIFGKSIVTLGRGYCPKPPV